MDVNQAAVGAQQIGQKESPRVANAAELHRSNGSERAKARSHKFGHFIQRMQVGRKSECDGGAIGGLT